MGIKRFITIENLTLLSIIVGILLGIFFPEFISKFKFIGDIFITLLKMVIVPLIFASVFVSIVSLGSLKNIKDLGGKTIFYYLATTSISVITGLSIVNILTPGKGAEFTKKMCTFEHEFKISDLILNIFPENPLKSLVEGKVLQIIFFAILFGLAVLTINEKKKEQIYNFFDGVNDSMIRLTKWIIKLTPIGVFFIVSHIVAIKGIKPIILLWEYILAVVVGLLIHAIINLGFLGYLVGKFNPLFHFMEVRGALLVAFSTASSSATLPISLEVAEEKAKISKKVAGFVLPLGATINMDGTALYEAVASMFIANIYGINLNFGQQIVIFLTATLASIGAAGIPSAGLVTMTLVLNTVGLPIEGIGIILAVDRFLDMLRTSVNVWGDMVGAKILDRFVK
ncbi:MAG: dicarboxylate/amino acid:cation symporter [Candidatus Desulfofervidus auxilii]|nr:dicarboxylate/amino acid:cation symporter [Candidatus Desulfofervidus auxilii]